MMAVSRQFTVRALLCGASVLAFGTLSYAQEKTGTETVEKVTVTGSRTITDARNSPTPVVELSSDQLDRSAPSNIPDALNKLPVFAASTGQQSFGSLKNGNNGNFLNLRSFGIIRTLILEDGRRVPATSIQGTVDTNLMPDLLVSRVDVVTGGASAVYGSDAVTGVVNFIIDNNFDGVKAVLQGGISTYGDDQNYKFGIAGGTTLLGGRGHIEGSYQRYDAVGIPDNFARPLARRLYDEVGAGTASNPFTLVQNARSAFSAFYPTIRTGPLTNNIFTGDNVLTPFSLGTPAGTAGVYIGGDGGWNLNRSMISPLRSDKGFGRFDYDFTDSIKVFAQATLNKSVTSNTNPTIGQPGFGMPSTGTQTVSVSNPYLSPTIAAQLAVAGVTTFGITGPLNTGPMRDVVKDTNFNLTTGLDGDFLENRYHWNVYYTYGKTFETNNVNNLNFGRLAAALDSTTSGGQIACRVATTNPTAYPGCVPLDPFGPPSIQNPASVAWIMTPTHFDITNTMHDVGAVIRGDIFDLPAGPLTAALSGEWRELAYKVTSTGSASATINCTGILIGCNAKALNYSFGVVPNAGASEDVSEGAIELNVPIVKDLFLAEVVSVNAAARYAHYSPGFSATTWKVGAEWQVYDELRFRGTMSRDIRAPTLNDLYAPTAIQNTTFLDSHTGVSAVAPLLVAGNPNLVPEVANAKTVGLVYQPLWMEGASLTVDYFNIKIANALSSITGQTAANQQQCEASNGTSPVCSLYIRPLPFSDHSAANFPTAVYTRLLNISKNWTSGFESEVIYRTDLGGYGRVDSRVMVSYQPVNDSILLPGQPTFNAAGVVPVGNPIVASGGAKWRLNFNLIYTRDAWSVSLTERWRSSLRQSSNPSLVFTNGRVGPMDYTDLSFEYQIGEMLGAWVDQRFDDAALFLTIENVLNKPPPVFNDPQYATGPNQMAYPVSPTDNAVGRFVTAGIRMQL